MKAGDPYVIRDAARELAKDVFASYQAIGISAVTAIPLIKTGRSRCRARSSSGTASELAL